MDSSSLSWLFFVRKCDCSWNYTAGLLPNHGNQGIQEKAWNFMFNQAKSGGKERYFEKSGKIREVVELLLFHFREVTVSILTHTSSWAWQLPSFPLLIAFCSVQSTWSTVSRFMNQNFELQKVGSRLSQTPHLSKEMIRISCKIRGKWVAFHEKYQWKSGNCVLK